MATRLAEAAFLEACRDGRLESAQELRRSGCGDAVTAFCVVAASRPSSADRTGLHGAARAGRTEVVVWLLTAEGGAARLLEARTNEGGATAFFLACRNGHLDCAQVLQRVGCDVSAVDSIGQTPLHAATLGGHTEVLAWLLTVEESLLEKQDDGGGTAFHMACSSGQLACAKALLSACCNVAAVDINGLTGLHTAGQEGRTEVLGWLLTAEGTAGLLASEFANRCSDALCKGDHSIVSIRF